MLEYSTNIKGLLSFNVEIEIIFFEDKLILLDVAFTSSFKLFVAFDFKTQNSPVDKSERCRHS
jgi:hypothetical protein